MLQPRHTTIWCLLRWFIGLEKLRDFTASGLEKIAWVWYNLDLTNTPFPGSQHPSYAVFPIHPWYLQPQDMTTNLQQPCLKKKSYPLLSHDNLFCFKKFCFDMEDISFFKNKDMCCSKHKSDLNGNFSAAVFHLIIRSSQWQIHLTHIHKLYTHGSSTYNLNKNIKQAGWLTCIQAQTSSSSNEKSQLWRKKCLVFHERVNKRMNVTHIKISTSNCMTAALKYWSVGTRGQQKHHTSVLRRCRILQFTGTALARMASHLSWLGGPAATHPSTVRGPGFHPIPALGCFSCPLDHG